MMRRDQKGFAAVEAIIAGIVCLVIVGVILAFFGNWIVNRPGQTEARAQTAAQRFVVANKIEVERLTCAYDNDGDGYGSCTLVSKAGEKIFLQCPARFLNTMMGADSCKEVDTTIQLSNKRR